MTWGTDWAPVRHRHRSRGAARHYRWRWLPDPQATASMVTVSFAETTRAAKEAGRGRSAGSKHTAPGEPRSGPGPVTTRGTRSVSPASVTKRARSATATPSASRRTLRSGSTEWPGAIRTQPRTYGRSRGGGLRPPGAGNRAGRAGDTTTGWRKSQSGGATRGSQPPSTAAARAAAGHRGRSGVHKCMSTRIPSESTRGAASTARVARPTSDAVGRSCDSVRTLMSPTTHSTNS